MQFFLSGTRMTKTSQGSYILKHFQVRWGSGKGEGSKHIIDNKPAELEIHLVHTKQGVVETTQRDYYAVIAVLVEADLDAPLTGPWALLNVSRIQSMYSTGIQVNGVYFKDLLPENRDYYYYPGSLTAPPCNETVQWFVLKERIRVPGRFLDQLRNVQGTNGDILRYNFRKI